MACLITHTCQRALMYFNKPCIFLTIITTEIPPCAFMFWEIKETLWKSRVELMWQQVLDGRQAITLDTCAVHGAALFFFKDFKAALSLYTQIYNLPLFFHKSAPEVMPSVAQENITGCGPGVSQKRGASDSLHPFHCQKERIRGLGVRQEKKGIISPLFVVTLLINHSSIVGY